VDRHALGNYSVLWIWIWNLVDYPRQEKAVTKLILSLRAIDKHGSDKVAWRLWREPAGYQWWQWPCLDPHNDWERVRGIPPARTAIIAEELARMWFQEHGPGLRIEITAGHSEASA
jgi:hypothetical protein